MSDSLNTEIRIAADATGVETGVGRAKRSLADLGLAAKKAGVDAADGVADIGKGGDQSARKVDQATKSMTASLQRLIAQQQAGSKESRAYWEALAQQRGVSAGALKPLLDQLDQARQKTVAARAANDEWAESLRRAAPLVATAFAGVSITGFVGQVVKAQREFDVLNSSLKTVTGSSEAAAREMVWLKDFAKETPFGLAQATQAFVKMKALGLDPTRAALTSFGNTASAMGFDLNKMIEAVADASTGEFERLREFGIKAKKDGDTVSLTFQGVTTTIRNSADEIVTYLERIGNVNFAGASVDRAKTLDGEISALGDSWDNLLRTISAGSVGSLIADSVRLSEGAIKDLTAIIGAMSDASDRNAQSTGAMLVVQGGIATVFETVAVVGANVAYVLRAVGTEIGGIAAQIVALASGDFSAARFIGEEMKRDADANRQAIDALSERILNARSQAAAAAREVGNLADSDRRRARQPAAAAADKAAIREAAALLKEQYANRLATIKESLAAEDGVLRIARARGELDERAYLDRLGEAQRESFAARAAVLRDQLAAADKSSDRERILGDVRALGAEAAKAAGDATLAYVELNNAARATFATLTSEAWGEVGQIATDNAALREELVTLGMTTAQLDAYRRQKTLAAQESANDFAAALEEAAAAIDDEGEAAQRAKQYYLDLAAARRAAAEQLGERATLERQLATSREALRLSTESAKVWQDGWQETDRIARDAFVAWADDGASAAERIGQSLRSALLSAIYEATLRPIALQVYTTAAGALGLSSGAAGAGAGSNLLGMASNAKSLYDLASGDYGLYGSFATSQYGQALGLSTAGVAASSIGTGASLGYGGLFANGATAGSTSGVASMSTLGSALPWAAGGGILAGVLYGGKGQSAAGGAIGAGVGYATAAGSAWASGAAMGSWAGPIGALAGAVISGFLGSRIGGGERFKSTYGSASGAFDDGRYTSTGAWQGGRQFGDDVDQVLDRATQAFSARLGSLYAAFGLDDQIAAQASVRLRRTSGRLASDFYADLDGDGPQGLTTLLQAQYGGDGEVEGALGEFVTAILTKGIKSAVEKSDLPEIVKQLYAPLTETADIEAATVTILAAQQILVGAGTTMADFLGSTAESYLRGEENLIGMLDRTVTALAAVNPVLEDIGLAAIEFTLAGGDLASQLAAISGGLDAFVGQASTYYQQFFSEEERLGRLSVRLAEQFEALGYAMPTDHAGFRALVEGLGEIDESTAGTFAALMNLAPAFDTVADAAKAAANNAIKAAEEHERTAATAVRSAFSAYEQAVRAQLTTDLAALDARHEALLPQMDARRSLVSQLGPMIDSIGDAVQHLRGTASPAAGSRSLDELLRGTFAGTLPDADALQQAIRGVTGDAAGNYATRADWQRAQAANAAKLDTLGGLMGKQKTLAEEALAVLEREVQAIEAQAASLETAASAQIDLMRQQVDGLLGIDSGVKSVEAAITQLSAAMQVYRSAQNAAVSADPARSNPNVGTVPSNAAPGVKSAYAHTSGVNVNPGDSALLAAAKVLYQAATGGVSTAQFNRAAASVGGDIAAAVGWKGDPAELRQRYGFAQGTNYVPWNMTADIHEGERIIPAADNRQLMDLMRRGANGGGATIDLTALLEEVRMLRAEMRATAQHSGKTARLIERVIPDGDALAVRAAA